MLTSAELEPFRMHPAFQTPPASAPPLVSSTTVESFVMVQGAEAVASGTLTSPLLSSVNVEQEAAAPAAEAGAGPADAAPTGGGNAPAGATTGGSSVTQAVAARAAAIVAMGSLPSGADGRSVTDFAEEHIVKWLDYFDVHFIILALCVWAVVGCAFMIGTAFALGRMSASHRASTLVTLRQKIEDMPSADPGREHAIVTTRFGKYWHRSRECEFLESSTQMLARDPCPACVQRVGSKRAPRVAETPPGSL